MVVASLIGSAAAAALTLPLVWKWQLGFRRAGLGLAPAAYCAAAIAAVVGRLAGLPALLGGVIAAALTIFLALSLLAYRFYRDPERKPPHGTNLIVSPADGEVVYVRRSEHGQLPFASKRGKEVDLQELTRTKVHDGDSIVIGIGMSFLDVHVNRAPIAGRIALRRHFPGRFGSLRLPEMVFENERATTVISGNGLDVAVVQIASRLVRQIAGFVGEGQEVTLGERIGVIRLGSQVDLILPCRDDLRVLVREGDHVYAGTSVVASIGSEPRQ